MDVLEPGAGFHSVKVTGALWEVAGPSPVPQCLVAGVVHHVPSPGGQFLRAAVTKRLGQLRGWGAPGPWQGLG